MTDERGNSPLHFATYCSNVTAIEMIRDHLIAMNQKLDPNIPNKAGSTPLQGLGHILDDIRLNQEEHRNVIDSLRRRTARIYESMRNLGACLSSEQVGIIFS